MNIRVSHDRSEETIEAKTRWFRNLPISDRMELLCEFTELALNINPRLPDLKNAQSCKGRVQVLSKP